MYIGLYFGSFNPVHHGHLIIASFIAGHTPLNQVWFVVSPQNPFKVSHSLLNEYQRLHLVRTAIEGEPKLRASDIEFHLPKPSYTIDTLAYLEEKYPQHRFAVIMGSDSFQNLHKWKNADVLMQRYPVFVYKRAGFEVSAGQSTNITVLDAPLLQISATQIREMVQQGKSVRYLVPDSVKEEIEKNGYYR
ncbi:nicotinate (nicotinamide) nucleotide adenylyltransferase [Agriterribacter sp.]|uniref:nicotinate (nicotinamide) nucleotide adenylyltransferase n=1 Tax=Agriterribacter sp. TaxID=2821509 RepID=UPI002B6BB03E|nr:nicotinate (nicotinamide) nucleotide adenylyltransferase [Agriterribacter sp.]HRO44489.1 nicotinate (nicotinamide) nucleotide adenylyltransferase [Agriterribacter sp.]HRQ16485.1 nicotinate (nicotinamide) nucleotide adenylyltransferase [Agriterribacter sp.]